MSIAPFEVLQSLNDDELDPCHISCALDIDTAYCGENVSDARDWGNDALPLGMPMCVLCETIEKAASPACAKCSRLDCK